jgi:putative SOS response-associated peptidase YedK
VCGRFTLRSSPESLAEHFDLDEPPELTARYNIAPGQPVLTIRADPDRAAHRTEQVRWGLVPEWAKDVAIGHRMINARAESVAEKPAFRSAFRKRRCLVPADGFYEWGGTGGAPRQPYLFARPGGGPFAFAGLFEVWHAGAEDEVRSSTIITTEANGVLAGIHDRMPVILDPRDYSHWLDSADEALDALQALLVPSPEAWLERQTVGTRVNSPRNDDPECMAPAEPQPRQGELW